MSAPSQSGGVLTASQLGVRRGIGVDVLPTPSALGAVLPWPGLRRGTTIGVHGSVSLLLALLSEATSEGSWAALVGMPEMGLVAADEMGVAVQRLGLIPRPGDDLVKVLAAVLDGVDLVVVGRPRLVRESDARLLSERTRHRRSVLLPFGPWPGADVQLRCTRTRWYGLGQGSGRLQERQVTVHAEGRGALTAGRSTQMCLPAREGGLTEVADDQPRTRSRSAPLRAV